MGERPRGGWGAHTAGGAPTGAVLPSMLFSLDPSAAIPAASPTTLSTIVVCAPWINATIAASSIPTAVLSFAAKMRSPGRNPAAWAVGSQAEM